MGIPATGRRGYPKEQACLPKAGNECVLIWIKYRGVGESSRPRQSHKLEIAGANPASATRSTRYSEMVSPVLWEHEAEVRFFLPRPHLRLWRNQVDASDLKSDVRKGVPVRFRSVVPSGVRSTDRT